MYSGKNSPKLRAIVYLADELDSSLLSGRSFGLLAVSDVTDIGAALGRRGLRSTQCMMLAATDAAIRAAKRLRMAVAGFVNPAFPGQSYYGVEMLIEGFDEVDDAFLLRIFQRHHRIPWTIAETPRCTVREFTMEDFDELVRLYDEPGIAYRIAEDGRRLPGYIEPLYPVEEERAYQENYIRHMYRYYGYGMWLVIDRESGCLIGRAGLENREYPEGVRTELGYLIHPAWQRQHIATEVCTAIIEYAGNILHCEELNLLTDAENSASTALAERLGFVYIGDTDILGSVTRRYRLSL